MSVRDGLLAVLSERPMHAYELRGEFERRTTAAWPLNMGQVTVTLASLAKAGLVDVEPDDDLPTRYHVTQAGRAQVQEWWLTAVDRATPAREEVSIKLALAIADADVDVAGVLAAQRAATVTAMQELTRLKRDASGPEDLGWRLTLDRMLFSADAEVRWLDHVTEQVKGRGRERPPMQPAPPSGSDRTRRPQTEEVAR